MIDFNKLNYLMAVAKLQSCSKAAKECYVAQPAVTLCFIKIEY